MTIIEQILIENSTKVLSNIEKVFENFESDLDETNSVGNLSGYQKLLTKVVTKLHEKSNLKHFCSIIPVVTSKGEVPVFTETAVGQTSDNTNTILLVVDDASSLSEGDTVTGDVSSASGTVQHVEPRLVLLRVDSGEFQIEAANTATFNIEKIHSNEWAISQLMQEFAQVLDEEDGEKGLTLKEIQFLLKIIEVECTSKGLKLCYSKEVIQDLMAVTGASKKWNENLLINATTKALDSVQKQQVISYMKNNAYVRPDLVLTDTAGVNGGIANIYGSLYARINHSIGAIGTNTGIDGTYSVLASSDVYAGLLTYLKGSAKIMDGYVLMPNGAKLIEDGYSFDDYLLVTLADTPEDPTNGAATLFTPYSYSIEEAIDSDTLQEVVKAQIRSDVEVNTIVELVSTKSTMMEYTKVTGFHAVIPFN